ncbi:MAG: hypothetical protein L3J41_12970 [Melioribacteraceae bacterium]|nr:hypothetical protein [Melioribacteraceae bacterium]
MSKIWDEWGIEDGDYIAEYDEPIKLSPFGVINTRTVLTIMFTIFSVALFAVVLNLIVKV